MGDRTSGEQVDIHNVPVYRVPQFRGERAPEAANEVIHLYERRSRPWVHHVRSLKPNRRTESRDIVQVFCKVPSTISEVEILDPREDDRSLDHQNERIGLVLGMDEQDMRVVEPLSLPRWYGHLSPLVGQRCLGKENSAKLVPLVQIGPPVTEEVG